MRLERAGRILRECVAGEETYRRPEAVVDGNADGYPGSDDHLHGREGRVSRVLEERVRMALSAEAGNREESIGLMAGGRHIGRGLRMGLDRAGAHRL